MYFSLLKRIDLSILTTLLLVLLSVEAFPEEFEFKPELVQAHHNRTKRQATLIGVSNGFNGFASVYGSIIKILTMPGKCCTALTHGYCGDGSQQESARCCGNGRCNLACCNCDDGCRRPSDNSAVAIVIDNHNALGRSSHKAFPIQNGECWNMEWWNDKISDILAIGCVTVWEHKGCTGAKENIVGRIYDLGKHQMANGVSWDNQISSLSYCGSPQ